MSAGLDASTVTPGSTAPEVSLTTPAMALVCASAAVGSTASSTAAKVSRANMRMLNLLLKSCRSYKRRSSPIAPAVPDTLLSLPHRFGAILSLLPVSRSEFFQISVCRISFRVSRDRLRDLPTGRLALFKGLDGARAAGYKRQLMQTAGLKV